MKATNNTIAISLETATLLALCIRTLARDVVKSVDPLPNAMALGALDAGAARALAIAKVYVDEPGGESVEAAAVELHDALCMLARDFRDGAVRWPAIRAFEDFVAMYVPEGAVFEKLTQAIDVAIVCAHEFKQSCERLAGTRY